MTTTLLLAVLAVTVVVVAGIAIIRSVAARKARAEALRAKKTHRIDQECASGGHRYAVHETGWRCLTCGNHVPRQEGELYGPAEDGRVDRRREPR